MTPAEQKEFLIFAYLDLEHITKQVSIIAKMDNPEVRSIMGTTILNNLELLSSRVSREEQRIGVRRRNKRS